MSVIPVRVARRRSGTVFLVLALIVGTVVLDSSAGFGQEPPGGRFWDDDGSPHEGWIEAIADAGVTLGCGGPEGDLFCPDDPISREQMAAMLVRALDLPASIRDWFADDAGFFEDEINALAAAGITGGCGDGSFCPRETVTRGQMAGFLARAFDLPAGTDRFTDDDGSFFEDEINAIAAAGITLGCGSGSFCPHLDVTRDQMASFLGRAMGLTEAVPPPRPTLDAAFTGDVLLHMPVNDAALAYGSGSTYDFDPMFAPVADLISGVDLAIAHLEVTLSPTSTGLTGYPRFRGPAEIATALATAGYEGASVASNHAYDYGTRGIFDTLAVVDAAELGRAGTATSQTDRDTPTLYEVEGVTIAHLSYTYGLNGFTLPEDQPWLANLIDEPTILADAAKARSAGADLVVVSMHWGSEYVASPTSQQLSIGRNLIDSDDIDLVVGHHAHVVQPIEKRGDEYIIYGLGNFLSNQRTRVATQDGVIVTVRFALRNGRWVTRSVVYTPTWVEGSTYRILPTAETLADGASGTLATNLRSSWYRTESAIHLLSNDASPTATP